MMVYLHLRKRSMRGRKGNNLKKSRKMRKRPD